MIREPMVKGAAIREFVAWYEQRHGIERLRTIAERAPEDLRHYLDPDDPLNILASSWYPARLVHSILDTLSEGATRSEIAKMAHDSNRWVVARGMNSVYRFMLERLVTPEMYAACVPWMWRQLHTTGERRITMTSDHGFESVVAHWPGHHPVLCVLVIETMCAVLEAMGKTGVRWTRRSCVSRGDRACVTDVTWRA